jgi:hypothetical protein
MGVVKWDILSINVYSQIWQDVYTFSKKKTKMYSNETWSQMGHV